MNNLFILQPIMYHSIFVRKCEMKNEKLWFWTLYSFPKLYPYLDFFNFIFYVLFIIHVVLRICMYYIYTSFHFSYAIFTPFCEFSCCVIFLQHILYYFSIIIYTILRIFLFESPMPIITCRIHSEYMIGMCWGNEILAKSYSYFN